MKRTIVYTALAATVGALLASTLVPDRERRQPGERRQARYNKVGDAGDESAEAQGKAEQFAQARTAPGIVLPGAYSAAFSSLVGLPVSGASWTEVTNRPYNSDDPRYRDPLASNSSGGSGLVSGRVVGIAVAGRNIFIGGANGGVFRSTDDGRT